MDSVAWGGVVTAVDPPPYAYLLKQAFRADQAGSPAILAETRRVATLYAASLLGARAAP